MVDRTGIEQAYERLWQALISETPAALEMVLAEDLTIDWPAGAPDLPADRELLKEVVREGRLRVFSYMTESMSMVPADLSGDDSVDFVGRSRVTFAVRGEKRRNSGVLIRSRLSRGRYGWQFLNVRISLY